MQNGANKAKIDQLFGEGLKEYREAPPSFAWDRLSSELKAQRTRKRGLIIRYAAAVVLLIGAIGIGYLIPHENPEGDIQIMAEQNTSAPATINDEQQINNVTTTNNSIASADLINTDNKNHTTSNSTNESEVLNTSSTNAVAIPVNEQQERSIMNRLRNLVIGEIEIETDNRLAYNTSSKYMLYSNSQISNMVAEANDDYSPLKDKNRWSLGGDFSPVYSYKRSGGQIAEEMDAFTNNTKMSNTNEQALTSISMGVNAGYEIAPRLSVESGIYFSRYGHQNQDLWIEQDFSSKQPQPEYSINTSAGEIHMAGMPQEIENQTISTTVDEYRGIERRYGATLEGQAQINVTQQFEYIEIPVVLKYKLNKGKIGINILGGMSSGILIGNYSLMNGEDGNILIGETENIDDMIYNGLAGLGVNYSITKNLDINMEPMVRYSFNSISSDPTVVYKPYSIGWYTGIKYKF
jgi:hypothetical protein